MFSIGYKSDVMIYELLKFFIFCTVFFKKKLLEKIVLKLFTTKVVELHCSPEHGRFFTYYFNNEFECLITVTLVFDAMFYRV